MQNLKIEGIWTALITPFLGDGSIDWPTFERLLEQQMEAGIHGIVIAGTTGEGPTLTSQEKLSLVRKAKAFCGKRMKIMAGTGGSNTIQAVELSKLCQDAGADALLVVTPPYNKPSPLGLKDYFSQITAAVSIPVCLYHVPGRTAQSLSVPVISSLLKIPGITSVKEATGDIAYFSRAKIASPGISFLSGDDPTFLASLAVGGEGVISVISNTHPKEMVELWNAFKQKDLAKALGLHEALLAMIDILFCEANPGPVKAAMHLMGYGENSLRSPLAPVTPENLNGIREQLKEAAAKLKKIAH